MQKRLLKSLIEVTLLATLLTGFAGIASAHSTKIANDLRPSITNTSPSPVPCLPSYNKVGLQDNGGNWHCWGNQPGYVMVYLDVKALHSDHWSGYLYNYNDVQDGYFCNGDNGPTDYGITNQDHVIKMYLSPVKIPECR